MGTKRGWHGQGKLPPKNGDSSAEETVWRGDSPEGGVEGVGVTL